MCISAAIRHQVLRVVKNLGSSVLLAKGKYTGMDRCSRLPTSTRFLSRLMRCASMHTVRASLLRNGESGAKSNQGTPHIGEWGQGANRLVSSSRRVISAKVPESAVCNPQGRS